ncbi:SPFH domain-containing protein [Bdellovibrionota bacterium FG-2]
MIVKPNQCAVLVYKGQITDVLPAGTHFAKTENIPVITRLANWKFGLESPLRAELWFFSGNVFTARRWGTAQPIVLNLDELGPTPLRAFGNYNVVIRDPKKVFLNLIGSRTSFDITDMEDFIQGKIVELFPQAVASVRTLEGLGTARDAVSKTLEALLTKELSIFGVQVQKIQVLSILPPQEVIQALDAKVAMKVLGNQKEYLVYRAANSLEAMGSGDHGAGNSMQMMLGLMLGKGLMGVDSREREKERENEKEGQAVAPVSKNQRICGGCQNALGEGHKFCPHCGRQT